jgi:hypothetical protein
MPPRSAVAIGTATCPSTTLQRVSGGGVTPLSNLGIEENK